MQKYISCGTAELFYPFKKYLPQVKYIKVNRSSVGYEQWESDIELLDAGKKIIRVDKLDVEIVKELNNLAQLWDEEYFEDWLHNVLAEPIFDNMTGSEIIENV